MKRKNSFILILLVSVFFGSLSIFILYLFYMDEILKTITTIPESSILISIILAKIIIISIMGIFLLYRWIKQDDQYFSDIPLLFSIFFIILVFGKLLDILINFLYYHINPNSILILIKIRFFLIIINLFPVLFLSIEMILIYLSLYENFKFLKTKKNFKILQGITLISIFMIESISILFAPKYSTILMIYPFFIIPFFIIIVWIFLYAHRSKRLSEINPLIVALGFAIFLITTLFRAVGQSIVDPKLASILSETFEILAFIIIFIGLIKKAKYYRIQD